MALALLVGVVGYFMLVPTGLDDRRATAPTAPATSPTGSTESPTGSPSEAGPSGEDRTTAEAAPDGGADDSGGGRKGHGKGDGNGDGTGGDTGKDRNGGNDDARKGEDIDLPELPEVPDCLMETPEPSRLTVLTYNIHGGRKLGGLARELRGWDADVVLLQEVDKRPRTGDQSRRLANSLGMQQVYAGLERQGKGRRGNAILSRYPIVGQQTTPLPFWPGPKAHHRGVVRATIDVDGVLVDVFNTHLQHTSNRQRVAQMQRVREVVAASDRPAVLGGDFNAHPGSDPMRVIYGTMRDVWADVGSGPGRTSPNRAPRRRIDYLMRNRLVTSISASVMPPSISDHRAVRAVVELPPPLPCTEDEN